LKAVIVTLSQFSTMIGVGSRMGSFLLSNEIGSGSFGSVWKATHFQLKQTVAIKILLKSSLSDLIAKTRLQREIALLKNMSHPFIPTLFQIIETADFYALVMEYAENGNLQEYIEYYGRMPEDQARRYFAQLISVLEYLHKDIKVAHRDLKPQNVLLDRHNNVRLIDFGLSNLFTATAPQFRTKCGSPAYLPPEMVKGQTYTISADIWSAGVLLFALVAGYQPFEDENIPKLLQKIVLREPEYPTFFTPALTNLLQKMMCKDPEQRITLEMIKNHPWFSLAEYAVLQDPSNFRVVAPDVPVDREIIDKMTELGIDCHALSSALLMGEFTDLTAVYRIFVRERMTEQMKNVMQKMKMSGTKQVPHLIARPIPVRPADRRKRMSGTPVLPARPEVTEAFATPIMVRPTARRSSKPILGTGAPPVIETVVGGSHETP
jgi:serine/threonine protein kinase